MDAPTQGQGIYFDGVTGVPQSVTLTLEEKAIAIESPDGVPLAHWDYSAIRHWPSRRERLRLGLADSPLTARLEVLDPACADVIKSRLGFGIPHEELNERRRRHRVVQWTIAAVVAVVVIGVAGMPAFARLLLPLIPRSAEVRMGLEAHLEEKRSFDEKNERFECGDAGQAERAGKAVFLQMFRRLEQAAALPILLRPYVIRTDEINASAFPGGYVHVNMGLINEVKSPDELGGVIGHEIGHVARRDEVRSALHSAGLSFLFGMVLGDLIGSTGVTLAALKLLDNKHTRAQEAAADAFGVELMRKLGADPHALATPFETWEKQPQGRHREMLLLRDHPTDDARIKAIRSTPAVANPKPLLTPQEWQTLKQVCSGR
jgi:Zn-dependent protease with chaperone function